MAVSLRARLAAAAPTPVFVAAGLGAGLLAEELAADPALRLVSTPRHAMVLVAAGRFPGHLGAALATVHDQLPHPRAVLWWRSDDDHEVPAALWDAAVTTSAGPEGVAAAVRHLHRELVSGRRPSTPDARPDVPPHLFEGRGDHGQGGEGMMGGVPYGRPMAMTGPDRDGLELDRLEARLGPFLTVLPGALAVDVVLQGGIVQQAELVLPPTDGGTPLDQTATDPADPRHRAVHLLRWTVRSCRVAGLDGLAARAAGLAVAAGRGEAVAPAVARLRRRLARTGLALSWKGVLPLDADEWDGAVAGDAADRFARRLAAAESALRRVEGPPGAGGDEEPETPLRWHGLASDEDRRRLGAALEGLDWADAAVGLLSLDPGPTVPVARPGGAR